MELTNNNEPEPTLFNDPNKYARPSSIDIYDYYAVLHGYQEFTVTRHSINVAEDDLALKKKYELIQPYFTLQYLNHRAVLDLGANSGFFCIWAIQNGADRATALDIDKNYLALIEKVKAKFNFQNIDIIYSNITDWEQPSDITIALALVHWIYACTAVYGSIDAVIHKIANLTKFMAIIEWVDPEDPNIELFHHTEWNKGYSDGTYNISEFERALTRHFERFQCIGNINQTRKLFVAFKTTTMVDLSGSLPLLLPKETVISSRILTVYNGIDYWSRVYDAGDYILKQTVLDLAQREAYFLKQFDCEYFPHVYDVKSETGYSCAKFEKIKGAPLSKKMNDILDTRENFYMFIKHCLKILDYLQQKGITHRDIHIDNIIIRNNKPVLTDFGWAVSEEKQYFTPPGLGNAWRPPDGTINDVYSIGKMLDSINQHKYPEFDKIIDLMVEPDGSLRIDDLEVLNILFAIIADNHLLRS